MRTSDSAGVGIRPPLLYAAAIAAVLVLHGLWPAPSLIVGSARGWGCAVAALGIGILVAGRRELQAAGTNIDPMQPTTAIVASGPYRYSRHPLYVALAAVYCGLGTAIDVPWTIVLLVPLLAVMHFKVVLREERYLERKFGESYRRYRAEVRRYV